MDNLGRDIQRATWVLVALAYVAGIIVGLVALWLARRLGVV